MHRRSPLCFTLLCPALLTTALAGVVPAGPLPGALQAPAARALVQGPQIGGPPLAVAVDPQKAAALGLPDDWPRHVLVHGPPSMGKTAVVRCVFCLFGETGGSFGRGGP